jgi:hypothetical protein
MPLPKGVIVNLLSVEVIDSQPEQCGRIQRAVGQFPKRQGLHPPLSSLFKRSQFAIRDNGHGKSVEIM